MFNFDIRIRQASENGLKPAEVMSMSHRQYTNFIVGQIRLAKAHSKQTRINNVIGGFYAGYYSGNYKNTDKPSKIINEIINEDVKNDNFDTEQNKIDLKELMLLHKKWK